MPQGAGGPDADAHGECHHVLHLPHVARQRHRLERRSTSLLSEQDEDGWVFSKPVEVYVLGLHDYYTEIFYFLPYGSRRRQQCLKCRCFADPLAFAKDVTMYDLPSATP